MPDGRAPELAPSRRDDLAQRVLDSMIEQQGHMTALIRIVMRSQRPQTGD